jgi:hypothetical protein
MRNIHQSIIDTFTARIYVAANRTTAEQVCREFCASGLCVTVEDTLFIYAGGEERGVVVGLLNYPRFPTTTDDIEQKALLLAQLLVERCYQRSALVVTPQRTVWLHVEQ